jgi:nitrogen fixation protein NifU and related proteins
MSDELEDLYQEVILDHNRHPRNFREMPDATRTVEGFNPLCGDVLRLYLKLEGDRIEDVSFQGRGCAISVASASMLTERLKGVTVQEAERLFDAVREVLTSDKPMADAAMLGKLASLAGVRKYPMRIKCATLGWHTLKAALRSDHPEPVTTE